MKTFLVRPLPGLRPSITTVMHTDSNGSHGMVKLWSNLVKLPAASEFAELEKSYRVLTDASARGALDDFLR